MHLKHVVREAIEYDVFVPLSYNEGGKISSKVISRLRTELLREFGGLTDFRHKNLGIWKFGNFVFRDEIVIFRVVAASRKRSRKFFSDAKTRFAQMLKQKTLMITERKIRLV